MIEPKQLRSQKKWNLDQKITDSKPHIWEFVFNSRFFKRKSRSQQKLAKKMTHLPIQFHVKNLICCRNLKSLNIVNKYTPPTRPKTHSLYKFFSKHVSGWCLKKCLHYTISRRPSTVFSELLERAVYTRVSPSDNFYSRDVKNFYLVRGWMVSLRWVAVWAF